MSGSRYEVRMPDIGLDQVPMSVSIWLVAEGSRIEAGDRIVEILAGEVIVDLPAPESGILSRCDVVEEQEVCTGQLLGLIETDVEL